MKKRGIVVLTTVAMAVGAFSASALADDDLVVGMAMNTEIDFVSDLQNALEEKGEEEGVKFILPTQIMMQKNSFQILIL